MPDYVGRFLFSMLCTIVFALFFEFGFRRSNKEARRVQAVFAGLVTMCLLVWTIYNLVRWRTTP